MNANEITTEPTTEGSWSPGCWVRATLTTGATVAGRVVSSDERGVYLTAASFDSPNGLGEPDDNITVYLGWSAVSIAQLLKPGATSSDDDEQTPAEDIFWSESTSMLWRWEQDGASAGRLGLDIELVEQGAWVDVKLTSGELLYGRISRAGTAGFTMWLGRGQGEVRSRFIAWHTVDSLEK